MTIVPDGHTVQVFGRTLEAIMRRMPGGLLVASTGAGGDDQVTEVAALIARVAEQVTPCPVVMNAELASLSELFAPAVPRTTTFASAAVLHFRAGSLDGWSEAGLAGLVASLRDLGRRTRLFACLDVAADVLRIRARLVAAGVDVRTPVADGTIVAEVHRPDGAIVTGVVAGALADDVTAADPSARTALVRAPRFTALILAIVRTPSAQARRALDDELTTRRAPLVLIAPIAANGEARMQPLGFGGRDAFVAYGDQRALHRAARELGLAADGYAVAAMPVATLFAWAASLDTPVMLCAFEDVTAAASGVWNVAIEVADLRALAAIATA